MSALHDVTKALVFYVSRDKRLWVERKPADDDPLVLRVKEYEKLIEAAEKEMVLGEKKSRVRRSPEVSNPDSEEM